MTEHVLSMPQSALYCDPGLGKTRAVIDCLQPLREDGGARGVLVVAPLRVANIVWPAEVTKWSDFRCVNMRTEEGEKAWKEKSADFYVINQEYLQQFVAKFLDGKRKKEVPVDMLVLDELGKFRNHGSKRAQALRLHRDRFRTFTGLTGTPTPNSYQDLFGQIRMIDGGKRFGNHFSPWQKKYFLKGYMPYDWSLFPGSQELIEEAIADLVLVMRSDEWLDIPPVTVEDIDLVLPPDMRKHYREMERKLVTVVDGETIVAQSAGVKVNKLRQMTGGAAYTTDPDTFVRSTVPLHTLKVEALKKLHLSIKKAPMLVGVQFIHEVQRIKEAIPWATEFDESKVNDWNAGKIPMWVANPKSLATGLNLQGGCCDVTWFSLPYSYEDYQQFNARVARTGQTRPTTIRRLMMDDTVDWAVDECLRNKESSQDALLRHLRELVRSRAA